MRAAIEKRKGGTQRRAGRRVGAVEEEGNILQEQRSHSPCPAAMRQPAWEIMKIDNARQTPFHVTTRTA
jgi:hypothetical protein